MRSITVHGMDPELAARLERQARESGVSLNKTIKKLLSEGLGIASAGRRGPRRDLGALCGAWSKQEASSFRKAVGGFERVDAEDWA